MDEVFDGPHKCDKTSNMEHGHVDKLFSSNQGAIHHSSPFADTSHATLHPDNSFSSSSGHFGNSGLFTAAAQPTGLTFNAWNHKDSNITTTNHNVAQQTSIPTVRHQAKGTSGRAVPYRGRQ
eukprot:796770_1